MNYKLCELLLEEVWNLIRIRTKYTFHSNRFCLFSCFPNILECCKCTRMRFHCAAAHLEGTMVAKLRFVDSNAPFSPMLLFTQCKTTWITAVSSHCHTAVPVKMSAFNSYMRENAFCPSVIRCLPLKSAKWCNETLLDSVKNLITNYLLKPAKRSEILTKYLLCLRW